MMMTETLGAIIIGSLSETMMTETPGAIIIGRPESPKVMMTETPCVIKEDSQF